MTTPQRLKVEPVPGVTFGAVITGIDLTDLSNALWADIEEAFNEYGMLIFPAQYLTADTQATFAKRFGPLQGADRAHSISNRHQDGVVLTDQDSTWLTLSYPTRYWHADGTSGPIPPKICILGAASVASRDGQTAFADMSAAYDALDQETKDRIANLNAYTIRTWSEQPESCRSSTKPISTHLLGIQPRMAIMGWECARNAHCGRWSKYIR